MVFLEALSLFFRGIFGATLQRYEARHRLLVGLAAKLGFRVYNKNLDWPEDEEFVEIWGRFPGSGKLAHDRKFILHSIAKSVQNVPGELVECGVFKGGGSFVILSGTKEKRLFGFDSFEGLSEPDIIDRPASEKVFQWAKNDMSVPVAVADANLSSFGERVRLYPGWIPDKFDAISDVTFALLHIDVDLYDPTFASLDFFYPRMNPGGVIVCDDYGFLSCPGARMAMDDFFADKLENVVHLTSGQGIVFVLGQNSVALKESAEAR
jgi:hypothetical protein